MALVCKTSPRSEASTSWGVIVSIQLGVFIMDSELIIIGSLILGVLIGKVLSANSNSSAKLLENKVDAIIEHLGVEFKPYKDTPEEVMSALKNGERIKAIKLYRQFSGLGLKEASDIISHIESSSKSVV
mgnify:CR=1 FL=1